MYPDYENISNNCGAKDHFERKCMKERGTNQQSRNQHQRRVFNIRDNNGPDEDDDSGDASLYSLTPGKQGAYAKCRMLVHGNQLVLENRHRGRSQYADSQIRQRCCPVQWSSHNME